MQQNAQESGGSQTSTDQDSAESAFAEVLDLFLKGKYTLLAAMLIFVALGVLYAFCATPVFRTDTTLQLEKQKTLFGGLDDLQALTGTGDPRSSAEIEILRSRSVLGTVVEQLKLNIEAEPKYFPLVGKPLARWRTSGAGPVRAVLGIDRFAWGGEKIVIADLQLPEELLEEDFELQAGGDGSYTLFSPEREMVLQGVVGVPAKSDRPIPVQIFVAELVARPGTLFEVRLKSDIEAIKHLQKKLRIVEKNRQSGILEVSMQGNDRMRIRRTVDAVATAYLRQNVERQSEEASRMLDFLTQQLPELKSGVDAAETRLREHKSKTGTAVELTVEGQVILDRLTEIERQLSLLNLERSEMRQRFTDEHPVMQSLRDKQQKLESRKSALEAELKRLPNTEWQSVQLVRDVKVNNELYVHLLNKSQELKISKAGTIGNVRIVDRAYLSDKAVWPSLPLIMGMSLLLGAVCGVMALAARLLLFPRIETPEALETALGIPVYAVIPHSRVQRRMAKQRTGLRLVADVDPNDSAVEGLRSLRASLQFAFLDTKNKVVAIHGPTPSLGKSFISGNLGLVLSESEKSILVIDADMRRGHMHESLGCVREPGLSNVLSGQYTLEAAVRSLAPRTLDFLSTGTIPPNPSELLMHSRFGNLLDIAGKRYDMVVIDCPPTLNMADALIIARHAGINFMVLRAGMSTQQEALYALRRMRQNKIHLDGVIFNDFRPAGLRRGAAGYYSYAYPPSAA